MRADRVVALASSVLVLAAAVTLLRSAAWKLVAAQRFRGLLRAHGVLPRASVPAVARLLPVAELGAGLGCLAVLGPDRRAVELLLRAGSVATVCLSAGFLLYLTALTRRRGGTEVACGCTGPDDRLGGATFVRAALLGLAGGAALVLDPLHGGGGLPRAALLCVLVATLTLLTATRSALSPAARPGLSGGRGPGRG